MKPDIPGLTVPAHLRLRPDHVGVFDSVVLERDYNAMAEAFCDFIQAVTDPENQPSQYGTMLTELHHQVHSEPKP